MVIFRKLIILWGIKRGIHRFLKKKIMFLRTKRKRLISVWDKFTRRVHIESVELKLRVGARAKNGKKNLGTRGVHDDVGLGLEVGARVKNGRNNLRTRGAHDDVGLGLGVGARVKNGRKN